MEPQKWLRQGRLCSPWETKPLLVAAAIPSSHPARAAGVFSVCSSCMSACSPGAGQPQCILRCRNSHHFTDPFSNELQQVSWDKVLQVFHSTSQGPWSPHRLAGGINLTCLSLAVTAPGWSKPLGHPRPDPGRPMRDPTCSRVCGTATLPSPCQAFRRAQGLPSGDFAIIGGFLWELLDNAQVSAEPH